MDEVRRAPQIPPGVIAGAAILAAIVAGRMLASGRISLGIAIVIAAAYIPLVFLDLAVAIGCWAALLFIAHLPALSVGPTAVELLLVLAWLGAGGARRGRLPVLRKHHPLVIAIVLFGCWMTLTTAWAQEPGRSAAGAVGWWESVLAFAVVASTLTTPRDVRVVALLFVVGAVISVLIGLLGGGGLVDPSTGQVIGARLVGGGGDPNFQAAGFLAAMFLAAGLLGVFERSAARAGLCVALALITVGFFATESRGGLLALAFSGAAALVLLPRQRYRILALSAVAAAGVAVWISIRPDALHRITQLGGTGSGRTAEWTIAWRIFSGHPLAGVGVDNFRSLEPLFTLKPGTLSHIQLVVEAHDVVHNTYLQLLTEAGVVGLLGFLAVVALSLRSSWLAARSFDAMGYPGYANLARAVLIGTIGMLAADFFLTNGDDFRLWLLFALGPVLLTLSKHGRLDAISPTPSSERATPMR